MQDKVFGQQPNLMGAAAPMAFNKPPGGDVPNAEGKSKRDLLWEQKRKERLAGPKPAPQPVFNAGPPPQQFGAGDQNILESVLGKGFDPFGGPPPPMNPPNPGGLTFESANKELFNGPPMGNDPFSNAPAGPPSTQG